MSDEVEIIEDWPEVSETPGAAADRKAARRGTVVSVGLSLVLHGLVLVVLVRMGVLRVGPTVTLQGGPAGTDAGDGGPGEPSLALPRPAIVPVAGAPIAPPAVDLSPIDGADMSSAAPPVLSKSPVAMMADASAPQLVGVPSTGGQDSPRFSHTFPARLQNGSGARGENASDATSTADSSAAYLMNQTTDGSGHKGSAVGGATNAPSGGPRGNGGGDSPIAAAGNKPPAYPAEAMRLKYEGTVVLFVEVLENGTVGEISIHQSSGHDMLDRAALDGVKRWHFTPGKVDGRPVRSSGFKPVVFELHG